jgi:hypothetical protein
MTSEVDPFVHDDAAYVLGALSDDERRAFEAHLSICADCSARVAEVRDIPDLLAGITAADLADEPVPDTLLPGLLRRGGRQRARQRWLVGGLGAAVAACLIAVAVVIWPFGSSGGTATSPPREFVALSQTPVRATAALVAKEWGTEIEVHCSYAEGVTRPFPYVLRVFNAGGKGEDVGSWTVPVGRDMDYQTGTRYLVGDISKLQILETDGTPILELDT